MKRIQWHLIVAFLVGLGVPTICFGQATGSAITGVVKDASDAVVAGATVTVTNVETGITRTRESDSAGRYRIGELPPGAYQVTVTMPGFARETRTGVGVMVGQELSLHFTLQVGAVEQEVVVTGEVPLVETTTAAVATVVTQEQLRELPLNGRSFTDLVTLQVAAVTPTNASTALGYGTGPQLSVAGGRTDTNSFTLDGTDMNATSNNTPGSAARVQLGVDTVREYQVITTNPKAEYGRGSGATINAVTRSGTNTFHGAAFEFLRNDNLDARRFVDAGDLPPFKRNQLGATLGGPIRRDKTFFFAAYEGLQQREGETRTYQVPTLAARQGIGILNPGEVIDPRVIPFLNLYPEPNGRDLGRGVAEYKEAPPVPLSENYGSLRVDHTFSANDSLFGRYTISRANQGNIIALKTKDNLYTQNQYVTLQEDHVLDPTKVNTFRAGYNRSTMIQGPIPPEGSEGLTFVPGTNMPMGSLSVSGLNSIGESGSFYYQIQNAFQFNDDLTYTRGAHTLKFGAVAQRFRWNTDRPQQGWGSIGFEDLRSFLLLGGGRPVSGELLLPESSTYRHIRTTLLGFYAQDDYRITPTLMLNYGLRWEFTTGLKETDDLISYLRNGYGLFSGDQDFVFGEYFDNRIRNFQPRLGFNWDIAGNQKNVLSGGFGVFHNQVLHNAVISFRAQLPFYFRAQGNNVDARGSFPDLRQMLLAGGRLFRETRHFDHDNFKTPTLYRYNLALQRQLPGQMSLRMAYIGSTGRHSARRHILNETPWPVPHPDGSGRPFFAPLPVPQYLNPNFSGLDWMSSDVNSNYNALALTWQKRFSHGMTFQANYTWSKSLDQGSSQESNFSGDTRSGQFSPFRHLEKARSVYNVPQVFVLNGVYELPVGPGKRFLNSPGVGAAILGGWQIAGIVTVQQGVPFVVTSNARAGRFGFRANRPNLNPGVDVNELTQAPFGTAEQFFDPAAFSVPEPGTLGNTSRSLLLGPAMSNVNITLSKTFRLGETVRLQFRGEAFNVFNSTNLDLPANSVFRNFNIDPKTGKTEITPGAGRITDTATKNRQIQFGLKLTF